MAICNGEQKSGKPKVYGLPEGRTYSKGVDQSVRLLLSAMEEIPLETAQLIHIEPLNRLRSALRLAEGNPLQTPDYKDDLYLISFLVPLMREVQRAHVQSNYTLPKHEQILERVQQAVIAVFALTRIKSFCLPDSFPEWMVPGHVAEWANTHEGMSLWKSAEEALALGWNPVTKRLGHLGDDAWGFGLEVDGLTIPFMVRLGGFPEKFH